MFQCGTDVGAGVACEDMNADEDRAILDGPLERVSTIAFEPRPRKRRGDTSGCVTGELPEIRRQRTGRDDGADTGQDQRNRRQHLARQFAQNRRRTRVLEIGSRRRIELLGQRTRVVVIARHDRNLIAAYADRMNRARGCGRGLPGREEGNQEWM